MKGNEKMINIEASYDMFTTTLSRLDNKNLNLNDERLEYLIFEELDSEYHSFLHEWTVDRLIDSGLLSASLRERILQLRKSIRPVMETKHDIGLYRNDPEWILVRKEANLIMEEIKQQ